MATHSSSLEEAQGHRAATLNRSTQSTDKGTRDPGALLAQATRVRDEALRLMLDRFGRDLDDVTQLAGCGDPNAFSLLVEYADQLTAKYLDESERMFELMRKLARDGLLQT